MGIATHLLVDGVRLCGSTMMRALETDVPDNVTCPLCRFMHWERQQPLEDVHSFLAVLGEIANALKRDHQHTMRPRHAWCDMLVRRMGGTKADILLRRLGGDTTP